MGKQSDLGKPNHESPSYYYSEEGLEDNDELIQKDNIDFNETRLNYKTKIEDISKMLKHQRNMKKIKKECLKNMVAGPGLLDQNTANKIKQHKQSYSQQKKFEGLTF